MLIYRHIVREIAHKMEDAASGALEAYREERAGYETMVTDRMLGAIEQSVKGYRSKGVTWESKTLLPGSGRSAEEKVHGADFLGVLDIDLSDFRVKKGFMAQAKRAEPKQAFGDDDWSRLVEQCTNMLMRTPDAFVFVYSRSLGIRVLPASSVLGSDARVLLDHYNHGLVRFFEDHLTSFIGDRRLNAPTIEAIETLAEEYETPRVLYLAARDEIRGD